MSGTPQSESVDKGTQVVDDYHYARFNIKVNVPEYTDEEYEAHLKNIDWTKEETDYLISLASEYDLRWIVIADRYEYKPAEAAANGDEMAIVRPTVPRTMEDMKARYYEVAANIMAVHHPLSTMSTTEFELHEKMTKFNPKQEKSRKDLAEALLNRSADEIKEEEILLSELKRIATNEEKVDQEREELYARLEAPQSSGSMAIYQTSQGLGQLMQTLLSADKSKKARRSLAGPDGGTSSPADRSANPMSARDLERGQRTSLPSTSIKKGTPFTPTIRNMNPKEEARYGITHHDRLTSGVTFRTARVDKLIQAKSTIQSAKIVAALTELGIPPKLVMPTAKVTAEFEKLVGGIQQLLEVRKVSEKVESEIRVLKAQKEERERRERGEGSVNGGVQTKEEENENEDQDGDGDVEMEDAEKKEEEDVDGENDNENDAEAEAEDAQDSNDEDGEGDNDNEAETEAADAPDSDDEDGEGGQDNDNENEVEAEAQSSNNEEDAEGSDEDAEVEAEAEEDQDQDQDQDQEQDEGGDAEEDDDEEEEDVDGDAETPSVAPSVAQSTRSAGAVKRSGSVISRGSESARSSRGVKRVRN